MKNLPSFDLLVESFSRLPGIGTKSAERMAYAVLEMPEEDALDFSSRILAVKKNIRKCEICGLYCEREHCDICLDPERDHKTIVVVASPKDAIAFEKIGSFKGVYHVLNGVICPSKGIGPEALNIDSLLKRLDEDEVSEIIIATNPTLEGETTALFISKLLEKRGVLVSRLAYGLPMGASLDYADSLTLSKALEGRKKL